MLPQQFQQFQEQFSAQLAAQLKVELAAQLGTISISLTNLNGQMNDLSNRMDKLDKTMEENQT
jgi:hypothetical protein